jgi:hypothetical protein
MAARKAARFSPKELFPRKEEAPNMRHFLTNLLFQHQARENISLKNNSNKCKNGKITAPSLPKPAFKMGGRWNLKKSFYNCINLVITLGDMILII